MYGLDVDKRIIKWILRGGVLRFGLELRVSECAHLAAFEDTVVDLLVTQKAFLVLAFLGVRSMGLVYTG